MAHIQRYSERKRRRAFRRCPTAGEPSVDAADIGVSVDAGVITLHGDVKTYSEKAAAERVALGVYGAKAVANDINVRLRDGHERNDTEVAQAVLSALKWNNMVPDERITVTVSNGWVTLKGKVDWEYQRTAAANAIRDLSGVRGVANTITLEPHIRVTDVKAKIESALKRSADLSGAWYCVWLRHRRLAEGQT